MVKMQDWRQRLQGSSQAGRLAFVLMKMCTSGLWSITSVYGARIRKVEIVRWHAHTHAIASR